MTEWCRIFIAEVAPLGQAQNKTVAARDEPTLIQGESLMTDAPARGVSRGWPRLLGWYWHVCARTNCGRDQVKRAGEAIRLEVYVAGKHESELCECAVNFVYHRRIDRSGLESRLV